MGLVLCYFKPKIIDVETMQTTQNGKQLMSFETQNAAKAMAYSTEHCLDERAAKAFSEIGCTNAALESKIQFFEWLLANQNVEQQIKSAVQEDDIRTLHAFLECCSRTPTRAQWTNLIFECGMFMGTHQMIELCCWYANPLQVQVNLCHFRDSYRRPNDSQYRSSVLDDGRNPLDILNIFRVLENELRHALQNQFPNDLVNVIMEYCWASYNRLNGKKKNAFFFFVFLFVCPIGPMVNFYLGILYDPYFVFANERCQAKDCAWFINLALQTRDVRAVEIWIQRDIDGTLFYARSTGSLSYFQNCCLNAWNRPIMPLLIEDLFENIEHYLLIVATNLDYFKKFHQKYMNTLSINHWEVIYIAQQQQTANCTDNNIILGFCGT